MKTKKTQKMNIHCFFLRRNKFVLILFLLIQLNFIPSSFAQNGLYTIDHTSLGTASASTSNTRGITPFVNDRKGSRSRYLYLANELFNEGCPTGAQKIASLAFNVTGTLPVSNTITNYNITLSHTSSTAFGTANITADLPGAVLVKTISSLNISSTGWFEIEFDTEFDWNGVDNIIVEVCKTHPSSPPVGLQNFTVSTSTFTDNKSISCYTNVNASASPNGCSMVHGGTNTATMSGSARRTRPNIRFTFKCNGNPVGGTATFKEISNLCLGEDVEIQIIDGEESSGLLYQWQSSVDGVNFINIIGENARKLTVSRDEVDTYYKRKTACCCGDLTYIDSQPFLVEGINTWDGSFWSFGTAPSDIQPIKITGNFDTAVNGSLIEACSLMVESGTFIVRSEHTIQLKDKIKVASGANVIFENNSSLIQENELAVNEGEIKYRRDSQSVRLLDYTYWSSPVSGQTPIGFSPNTPSNRTYHWNHLSAVQNWTNGVHNLPMIPGKGYIIRSPNGFPSSGAGQVFNGTFIGVPNNGEIEVPTQGKNPDVAGSIYWNLLGNPYPSAIDSHAFLIENASKIDGTINYWTHNSTPSGTYPGSNGLNYNSNDYATYNLTGSVGIGNEAGTITDPNDPNYVINQEEPGRYIGAGQSFMIAGGEDVGEGSVKFTNAMRVIGENKQFFRTVNSTQASDTAVNFDNEKHRVWLEVKHQDGAFKQTLIGYVDGATNGLDWGFDGKLLGTSPVAVYSFSDEQKLIIQGRAFPFDVNDMIPLGFSTTVSGTFELNLYKYDGVFQTQEVYLEDTYTNTIHNIKEGIYTFNAVAGVYHDRFILRFTNETLGINPNEANSDVICFAENNVIHVKTLNKNLDKVKVFDGSGRILYEMNNISSNEFKIESLSENSLLLLIQVTSEEGIKSTHKLIY